MNISKIIVAVALTLALTVGTGIVGEQIGFDIVPPAYAGNTCSGSSGGGC